jgi:hypothetical protein
MSVLFNAFKIETVFSHVPWCFKNMIWTKIKTKRFMLASVALYTNSKIFLLVNLIRVPETQKFDGPFTPKNP